MNARPAPQDTQQTQHAWHEAARVRRANVRTALVLAAIALVFFVGILAVKFMGDTSTGMTVLGSAVLLFLALAIGRNLRR